MRKFATTVALAICAAPAFANEEIADKYPQSELMTAPSR